MREDRAAPGKARHKPLRLAKAVGAKYRDLALRGVRSPPRGDAIDDLRLRLPTKDRQSEGALRDEGMTGDRLERLGQTVGFSLVIARDDPSLASHSDPDLGRPGHMACRVEGHCRRPDLARRAVGNALSRDRAKAFADHRQRLIGGQIGAHPRSGVVTVAMGDQCARNRAPGIDVEIPSGAVDAVIGKGEDGIGHSQRVARSIRWKSECGGKDRPTQKPPVSIARLTALGPVSVLQACVKSSSRGAESAL